MGSPSTLKMRPNVSRPTGTEICAPVFLTVMPRVRPSVDARAIARTLLEPKCRASSHVASTTGPMICTIFPSPVICVALGMCCFRSGRHLNELTGNPRLPCFIIRKTKRFHQLFRIVRRVFHGNHARGVFTCIGFKNDMVYMDADELGHEGRKDFGGRWLEQVFILIRGCRL